MRVLRIDWGSALRARLLGCLAALLFGTAAMPWQARAEGQSRILLNAGVIDTSSRGAAKRSEMLAPLTGKSMRLVQFPGPIQPEWYSDLAKTGVKIVTYIPENSYLVWGTAQELDALRDLPDLQWEGAYIAKDRVHPLALAPDVKAYSVQLVEDVGENLETLALADSLATKPVSEQRALGYVNLVLHADKTALSQLSQRPDVVSIQPWVEPTLLDERQDIILSGQLTGNGPSGPGYLSWLASKGFTQAQFDASGFGVDVSDSGVDNATPAAPNHFGLYKGGDPVAGISRLVYSRLVGTPNSGSTIQGCDGHGTLNSHIICGYVPGGAPFNAAPHSDASGYKYGLGVAPFVKVGSSVIFDPGTFTSPDYEDLQSMAYQDGMRLSSNSWGASTGGAYTADSQRYDALVRDAQPAGSTVPVAGNQEMLILFAAGNNGSGANTVGSPGTAKNVITVGASENVHAFGAADQCGTTDSDADSALDIVGFSSRGPCDDARHKPDIVAPGTHVSGGVFQASLVSPVSGNGAAGACFDASGVCAGPGTSNFWPTGQQWTTASSGTSHSTPAVAGGAALLRQYFINQGMSPPSPAMAKAFLMNSARYMTGTGANDNLYSNNQGMGLMDLGMAFDGVARFLEDQVPADLFTATGQSRTFNGFIGSPAAPFRVTLAWTDAPGSTTGSAFKNNLDLTVTVGGNTYQGNVFTGAFSTTGGTANVADNVESVFLPAGVTGPYTITVTATNVNSDGVPGNASVLDQDFALVVYNTCATQPSAPTGVGAAASAANQITVSFTENGSTDYRVYRATTAGGPYTFLGTTTTTPYVDTTVSGGTTYYYVVRARICAESVNSTEASATATGACTLSPTFSGLTSVTNPGASTCQLDLAWSAGTAGCSGPVQYNIYRSTTSGFVPGAGNRIQANFAGTSYSDSGSLVSGTTYYYVVRAVDASNAVEETNTIERSGAPSGAIGTSNFDETFEGVGGFDNAGWTTVIGSGSVNWALSTAQSQTPTHSWFSASQTTVSDRMLITPSFGVNPSTILSFFHTFAFENATTCFDGGTLEISTDGGSNWAVVPDAAFTAGLFTGTVSAAFSNPIGGKRAWCKGTIGAMTQVTVNLGGTYSGQNNVKLRWHEGDDSSAKVTGWFVDSVNMSNVQIAGTCSTVSAATSTPTDTPTSTPTDTPTSTPTDTPTSTPTDTPTSTPTNTPTSTPTDTPTSTPTNTPTSTATNTPTDTPPATATDTPTSTATDTPTDTPTATATDTPTDTPTPVATATATNTAAPATPGPVVISQVYGAGGEAGSVWSHDFVELFNRSSAPVNLANWTVQYANTNSSTWQATVLGVTLQPGQYYLLQLGTGASGGAALPSPDLTGTTAMNATLGKVALMPSRTRIAGLCPAAGSWVDFVGYGSAITCYEGGSPTGDLSLLTSAQRAGNGCVDSNNNGADFAVSGASSPGPRNSGTALNSCTAAPTPTPTRTATPLPGAGVVISQVYGSSGGAGSPWKNDFVELFNRGTTPVNLYGWSLQYANTDSATWQKTLFPIGTTLQPGRYLLLKQGSGGGVGAALPAADVTNTVLMNAVLGKVALVNGTAGLLGKCPAPGTYVDFVGYGSAVSCSEGGVPTGDLSNPVSAVRNGGGCVDTGSNGADFTVQGAGAPGPRNSLSPANPCGAGVAGQSGPAGTSDGSVAQSGGQPQGVAIGVEMGQPLSGLGITLFALLAAGLLARLRKLRSSP